eukprot:TRINITY_DN5765_c0_g1_i3.p1 TRINITY_DN5765_c0_g1~~TRINITY_DN5765_c0_g1_i3.p1  ORF type:complete len:350 (+),score=99.91 TRINITY_DN5765_c0_g1_i3:80-1051(+)
MRAAAVSLLAAGASAILVGPGGGGPGGGPGGDPGSFFGDPTPIPTPVPTPVPPLPGQGTQTPAVTGGPAQLTDAPIAGCPDPGDIATLVYFGGAGASIYAAAVDTAAPQAWLPSPEQNLLRWPEGADWLKCAVMYRLGETRLVPRGSSVNVVCTSEVCDVYAIFYHAPTHSSGTNGNLPLTLSDGNWTPSSCSPAFTTSATGPDCWYPTVAYRKQVLRNTNTLIQIDANVDAMYMTVVVVRGTLCTDNIRMQSQQACEGPPASGGASVCSWDADAQTCRSQWCPRASLAGSPSGGASGGPGGGSSGGAGGCPPPDVSVPQREA